MELTIIICSKNSEDTIRECLKSVMDYPVILVDKSTDRTKEIAYQYSNVKVINQESNGLANARNEGLMYVNTKYVMMLGSDNAISVVSGIDGMDIIMKYNNWVGVGLLTKLLWHRRKYLDSATKIRWEIRIIPGEKDVIGTPYIYYTEILKKYGYKDFGYSDDTDLCKRLKSDGHKVGYSAYYCHEISDVNMKSIIERFINYGKGDREYYKEHGGKIFHAFSELSVLLKSNIKLIKKIKYMPYFIFISIVRFIGFMRG